MAFPIYPKDPSAVLDFVFDFASLTNGTGTSNYLEAGETIASKTVTATAGITVDSSSIVNTNTAVRVWLSGGVNGDNYEVTCRIVTSASRTDDRTIKIQVRST